MRVLSQMQSRLGMARSDVTVALFLSVTALIGFVYTTFLDERSDLGTRHSMLMIEQRHDSIMNARAKGQRGELQRSIVPDSAAEWSPLTAADTALDAVADAPKSTSGKKGVPSGPVNINTAGRSALMQLPGIGEKTAEAIIAYRAHLPFRRPEDIMNVKGIGEKKFEKMKPYVSVK